MVLRKIKFLRSQILEKRLMHSLISFVFSLSPRLSQTARFTEADSTQARGSAIGSGNAQIFSIDPIINRFRAPTRTVGLKSTGDDNHYFDWAGSMMANSMHDPFFLSAWMISNELINAYINDIPGASQYPGSNVYQSWKVRVLRVSAHK